MTAPAVTVTVVSFETPYFCNGLMLTYSIQTNCASASAQAQAQAEDPSPDEGDPDADDPDEGDLPAAASSSPSSTMSTYSIPTNGTYASTNSTGSGFITLPSGPTLTMGTTQPTAMRKRLHL